MNKTVIYTSIINPKEPFGIHEGYDTLKVPLYVDEDCDYICFTNNPHLKSDTWNIIQVPLKFNNCSVRTQREPKILAHKYFPEYERSLYIDGTILINRSISKFLTDSLKESSWIARYHDKRNCVYDEAQHIINIFHENPKDTPENVKAYIEKQKFRNYPKNNGLYNTSAIMRNHNDPQVIKCLESWWREYSASPSKRDQLSLPYAFWENNFEPVNFSQEEFDKYLTQKRHRIKHNKIRSGHLYD